MELGLTLVATVSVVDMLDINEVITPILMKKTIKRAIKVPKKAANTTL